VETRAEAGDVGVHCPLRVTIPGHK
jgi:hypothetical protein